MRQIYRGPFRHFFIRHYELHHAGEDEQQTKQDLNDPENDIHIVSLLLSFHDRLHLRQAFFKIATDQFVHIHEQRYRLH